MSEAEEMFTVPDERIREVLDVLTGWSGNAARMSAKERNEAATNMLNDLLRAQPVASESESLPFTLDDQECWCGATNDTDCKCGKPDEDEREGGQR